MAAASILEWNGWNTTIHLFEKNSRLGAKVIISGWWRCNVTTGTFKRKELLKHYTRGADFLDYAFRQYSPKKIRKWFEDHGVPLKEENDGRIFPVSDDGHDIVAVFENLFATSKHAHLHFKEPAQSIDVDWPHTFTLTSNQWTYACTHIIVATGGEAYAHTGSTGDGYSFARSIGHTITPLGPSLNSFMTTEKRIHACSGISFQNASFSVPDSPELKVPGSWPVMLTHFWVTWPHVFVLASHCAFKPIDASNPLRILFKPDSSLDAHSRDKLLVEYTQHASKKTLYTVLSWHFPKRFVEHFLDSVWYAKEFPMSWITKQDRLQLAEQLGHWIPLTLTKRRPWDEFVTAWWVVTDEVDPTTMESKITSWVYFVWEVLNIDWVTWWYNLQASWATGKLAWDSIESSPQ